MNQIVLGMTGPSTKSIVPESQVAKSRCVRDEVYPWGSVPYPADVGVCLSAAMRCSRMLLPLVCLVSLVVNAAWLAQHVASPPVYHERDPGSGVTMSFSPAPVVEAVRTPFQHVEVRRSPFFGTMLVIDDDLMLTQRDEASYHEMATHVPLAYRPDARTVSARCATLPARRDSRLTFMVELHAGGHNWGRGWWCVYTSTAPPERGARGDGGNRPPGCRCVRAPLP